MKDVQNKANSNELWLYNDEIKSCIIPSTLIYFVIIFFAVAFPVINSLIIGERATKNILGYLIVLLFFIAGIIITYPSGVKKRHERIVAKVRIDIAEFVIVRGGGETIAVPFSKIKSFQKALRWLGRFSDSEIILDDNSKVELTWLDRDIEKKMLDVFTEWKKLQIPPSP
ncbi:MAG: hypothetical protein WC974_04970 [Thermoplasmata archaeon]